MTFALALLYLLPLLARAFVTLLVARQSLVSALGSNVGSQQGLPTVAVLQPVTAHQAALESSLAATLHALPATRVVWLVHEDDAQSLAITRRLVETHPDRRVTRLVLRAPSSGMDPVRIMLDAGWRAIEEEVVVALDASARIDEEAFGNLVRTVEVGALSLALPLRTGDRGLRDRMLTRFVLDNAPLAYLSSQRLAAPDIQRRLCYAVSRHTLHEVGGFRSLLQAPFDAGETAPCFPARGLRLKACGSAVSVVEEAEDPRDYVQLMRNWVATAAGTLGQQPGSKRLLLMLLHVIPPFVLWALLLDAIIAPSWWSVSGVAIVLFERALVLHLLRRRFAPEAVTRPILSIMSELLQPLHVMHALLMGPVRPGTGRSAC